MQDNQRLPTGMQDKTYNKYLTEGIINGEIKEIYRDGVRIYIVRRPAPGEEVVGFINFSSFLAKPTPTVVAGQGDA